MRAELLERLRIKLKKADLLPLRNQADLSTRILKERLEVVLPWAMEQSGFDFWLVAARENGRDPGLKTLYPWDMYDVRRLGMLAFYRQPQTGNIRKMMMGPHSPEMEGIYESVQRPEEDVWDTLRRVIRECNPRKIAINRSFIDGFCDGLTSTLYEQIKDTLLADAAKLCDGESLTTRWLQRVSPLEKEVMRTLVNVTHEIINYSFSSKVIKVGETTTTDVEWFMRELICELGFLYWFGPDVDLQRRGSPISRMFNEVILPGDLLHCDIGLTGTHIQLHTDLQWVAYVLGPDETEAPEEFANLLTKGNRLQDIVRESIRVCATGNEAFLRSIRLAQDEGLNPMVYTHPIGTFGHGAGPRIGQYGNQVAAPGPGERPIEDKTFYALELNVAEPIKIWDDQLVYMYLEEDICKDGRVDFLDGRQEELILIGSEEA